MRVVKRGPGLGRPPFLGPPEGRPQRPPLATGAKDISDGLIGFFHRMLASTDPMKKQFISALAFALALIFSAVTSLSIFCAVHHGLDGLDHPARHASHGTDFCSALSKLGTQTVLISSATPLPLCDHVGLGQIISVTELPLHPIQLHLARPPPVSITSV